MAHQVILLPRAEIDLFEQAEYLTVESIDLASRFLADAKSSFEFLRTHPEAGSSHDFQAPELEGIRVWPVKHFPKWLVFYRVSGDRVEIVRVLHCARDIGSLFG